jgi:glycosyltransferase involved in cell wall biosynthesis
LRVLVSAYACEPGKGSEPGCGWNWVQQIARFHEAWVITRANNRQTIDEALAQDPMPRVHWVYFDLPRWARFWKKGRRGIHLYYYLWQLGAYFVGRRLHQAVDFDVVHHVTLGTYWMPSFLALLPVPFVWGPVGGGESAPRNFWFTYSSRGKTYEFFRDLVRVLGGFDPFVRLTAQRSACGLATSEETATRMRALGCRKLWVPSKIALSASEIQRLRNLPHRQNNSFRLLSIGNLLHLKAFNLGLAAFAELQQRHPTSEYWLIGDGPERSRLEKLARKLGVAKKVTFWGSTSRSVVLEKLSECDVLLHPALHESGGWVCQEAMAAGLPVVCLDLGGLALQVTEETGIKIPALSPAQAVSELAAALIRLAEDPALRARMGRAAQRRVEESFNWDGRGDLITGIYTEVTDAKTGKLNGASACVGGL